MVVIIVFSGYVIIAQDVGSSYSADKAEEDLLGPEATVEAEGKYIEVASQMLFAQAMVGSGINAGER